MDRRDRDSSAAHERGFGDDQGTRIGSPEPSGRAGDAGTRTGAGSEASVGIRDAGEDTADIDHSGSRPQENVAADVEREPGSEPLHGRTTEHESGYGGVMGEPRTSSDEREETDGNGMLEAE